VVDRNYSVILASINENGRVVKIEWIVSVLFALEQLIINCYSSGDAAGCFLCVRYVAFSKLCICLYFYFAALLSDFKIDRVLTRMR
jgi:hypothetical protein